MVKVETEITEKYHLIVVEGEVDASSSIELDNAIKSAADSTQQILVDLSGMDYISSAGLGVFISYLEDLKKSNTKLIIYGLQDKVLEVFDILGLQQIMTISQNREEALAALNEG